MRRIVVTEFVTLDGVMQDPGGAEKFERGGWAFKFERGPEGDRFKADELYASDASLLGRVTYQGFAAAWPSRTGDFADKMNGMHKYVVSKTLTQLEWNNSSLLQGDLLGDLQQLKAAPGGDLLVAGSGQLVQFLAQHGLVDEYRLMVFPVLLGKGKKLFNDGLAMQPLQLVEARAVGTAGVMTFIYHPVEP